MEKTLLFDFGIEGGGASVYQFANGKVIETGSSGGILDEEEDPFKTWEKAFNNWEDWWQNFVEIHDDFWICFCPSFIHTDIRPFIQFAVNNYTSTNRDLTYHKQKWDWALQENV